MLSVVIFFPPEPQAKVKEGSRELYFPPSAPWDDRATPEAFDSVNSIAELVSEFVNKK
jgi:hypothetical protein